MLESIGTIFSAKERQEYTGTDIRPVIEVWLQRELLSDQLYCVDVSGESVSIRVGSPVLYQEVLLRWAELKGMLRDQYHYTVSDINLSSSYY